MDVESPFASVAGPASRPAAGASRTFRWCWAVRCTSCCGGHTSPTTTCCCSAGAIVLIAAIVWLPLLLLTAASGHLLGGVAGAVPDGRRGPRQVPARAAAAGRGRTGRAPAHAAGRGDVPRPQPDSASSARPHSRRPWPPPIACAIRCPPEVALLAFVYVVGITIVWRQYMSLDAATWYATPGAAGSTLTLAGPGTGTSACRCSSSCCAAGISGSSSGRGCSGRFRASSCSWCRRIRTASAASASSSETVSRSCRSSWRTACCSRACWPTRSSTRAPG